MATTGYSGTPLAQKLGLRPGMRVVALDAPRDYREFVAPWPEGVVLGQRPGPATALVHVFATERAALRPRLVRLREVLAPDAVLWVSWPKQAARVATDLTEDTIRADALPLGWVDVKVCAVDERWSGLKLVVRRTLR